MTKHAHQAQDRSANTLRLEGSRLQGLMARLDATAASGPAKSDNRDYRRWPLCGVDLRVDVEHPGGTVTSLRYVGRNLSGSGAAFLHASYVHLKTRVVVHVPHPTRGTVAIPGIVSRCRLTSEGVHEIGVRFRDPIRVRDHLKLSPFDGRFSLEKIDPVALKGTVLHIEGSAIDRQLIRCMLEGTALSVSGVETSDEALTRAKEPFDIILCDTQSAGADGYGLCQKLREAGVQSPVLLTTIDANKGASAKAQQCGASALLRKPIARELLLAAIAEFQLLAAQPSESCGPIQSTLAAGSPLAKFLPEFVDLLKSTTERLGKALSDGDTEAIRSSCFQVMGAAASLGLEPIARAANAALDAVAASPTAPETARAVNLLIAVCQRVKKPDPAAVASAPETAKAKAA